MKKYFKTHPWQVIEQGFSPAEQEIAESICSLGNGRFGLRGNFEETYTGKSLSGSYVGGVYYPDLTRVGWWKNGYPEYFAKVLNAVNWIGIDIYINDEPLDLHVLQPQNFVRKLDMKEGILYREFSIPKNGGHIKFSFERFCNMHDPDLACVKLTIKSDHFDGKIDLKPYLNFDVHNKDSNYGDQFWENFHSTQSGNSHTVTATTKKTTFTVTAGMVNDCRHNGGNVAPHHQYNNTQKVSDEYTVSFQHGGEITLVKYISVLSSLHVAPEDQSSEAVTKSTNSKEKGFDSLKNDHIQAWESIWKGADIQVEGNEEAQQGIRFCIFHMWQTYTGADPRLNIGPKGFTGEKYGGSTYWDTEAYCLPFYLGSASPEVARNLLVYRYLHLEKAIENAQKLGFNNGAALYPMVTMNGEECHNEWEITFEEIHRNGAIVYAIHDYIRYTNDKEYMADKGIFVLIGVARFWAQRVNYSNAKNAYVMLGVTGPNEYENNVNNNWYTNFIARWCLEYAHTSMQEIESSDHIRYAEIISETGLTFEELQNWDRIRHNMYFPVDPENGLFLQQDGFLDKELMPVTDLPADQRPINQKWSWDRILRSCFIKQADVLQGMYFFEEKFDLDTIRRHFEFYEPMTVHESSLSPCVHAILASRLEMRDKAQEMYLRTSRLDLDNYNNDTEDGLHITSMAGSWMSVVRGFAGMMVKDNQLHLSPFLPQGWTSFSFATRYRHRELNIKIDGTGLQVSRLSGDPLEIVVSGEPRLI